MEDRGWIYSNNRTDYNNLRIINSMPNIPKQFIIATLDDAKLHPIFSDTITYLGKTASVGLKVPFYIVLNYSGTKIGRAHV